jgi:uncharacterized Zn finger protein
MSYFGWKPYVSVAERRKKAEKAAAKAKKTGASHLPIGAYRGAIAKTFWGKAWCDNLERYSDYANRLPHGRTYVRNGSVIDLNISAGEVRALVMGSSLYKVAVTVTEVPARQWQSIGSDCSGSIDSLVELLQGKLSKAVMERICKPGTGLFPAPKEIKFSCSCPDWASMCKHVAAVLYGVGARLDQQPELLFGLRRVNASELVAQAGAGMTITKKGPAPGKVLQDAALADVFGIEMAEIAPPTAAKKRSKATAAKVVKPKPAARKATPANRATSTKPATASKAPVPKLDKKSKPTKASAGARKPAAKIAIGKGKDGGVAIASKPKVMSKRSKKG